MRQTGNKVGDPHQRALAEPDQHQAVYRCEHRLNHVPPDPLPIGAEQPVAQLQQAVLEIRAVAKQEKQREQGEPEDDQPMDDFPTVMPRRFGCRAQIEAPEQLLGGGGIAQIGAPPIFESMTDRRELRHPVRHGDPAALRLGHEVDGNPQLARSLQRDINKRHGEDQPDQQGEQQSGAVPCRRGFPGSSGVSRR